MISKLGEVVNEDFTVVDRNNNLVTGLIDDDFSRHIFDPNGNEVSGFDTTAAIDVEIYELGNGHYRATFIPNIVGIWYLAVYHTTYFPWGKEDMIQVFNNDFDSINDLLLRVLGLTQENQYIDNTNYDTNDNLTSCRIRIYDDPTKVGTSDNVISTYLMIAGYTGNTMDYYKVVKQ